MKLKIQVGENMDNSSLKNEVSKRLYEFYLSTYTNLKERFNERKIVLFGAALCGSRCLNQLKNMGLDISAVCDNNENKWGKTLEDIAIISPSELSEKYQDAIVIISVGFQWADSIYNQLHEIGIECIIQHKYIDLYLEFIALLSEYGYEKINEYLLDVFDYFEDEKSREILLIHFGLLIEDDAFIQAQNISFEKIKEPAYFLDNGKLLGSQKVMIDCGAYIGDTLLDLVNRVGFKDFQEYICFEFDQDNYNIFKQNISGLDENIRKKIIAYNYGVGDREMRVYYCNNAINSTISEIGDKIAKIVKIDDYLKGKEVSFLKMDIEGSELAAIKGAEKVIKNNRPMCAISIYHNVRDFWEIPFALRTIIPDYKFYLRKHTADWDDTVCYTR